MRPILSLLLYFSVGSTFAAEKLILVAGSEKDSLHEPFGLGFSPDNELLVVEFAGHRLSRIDADGKIVHLAGDGTKGDLDGPAARARFNGPHNLAIAGNGDIYISDTFNHKVKKVGAKTRETTTLAGTGKKGVSANRGPLKTAEFDQLYHVALDASGQSLFVVDLGNRRILQIDLKAGTYATVAGNGKKGIPDDGAIATEAPLVDPRACAVDAKGRLYILERGGHALRVVEDGKIRTVAGTGKQGFSGDGGPAIEATLNGPKMLCIDGNDDVLIADTENHAIRKYEVKSGRINRIAGTGKKGSAGVGGPPVEAELARPHGIAIAADGTIFIADSENHRVLKLAPK